MGLTVAIVGEYYTALDDDWHLKNRGNLQHIMMYAFFALHPIFELLYYHGIKAIPAKLDYLSAILAYVIEAFLFKEHLHGRSHMDVQLHTYLVYAIFMCILMSILEMVLVNDARPALGRATFAMLQGTWFFQVAL